MTFLLTQIFVCLIVAAVIGAVAAWLFRRNIALEREDAIQQQWKGRIRQIEIDRDRNVHRMTAEIDRVKNMASKSGQSAALDDYENLANKLEGQVAERENAIAGLRAEIQTLRDELTASLAAATQRETSQLQQYEQEVDQPDNQDMAKLESRLTLQHEQQLAALTDKLTQQHDQALSQLDSALHEQHEKDIADLTQRLMQQKEQALGDQESQLRQQFQEKMAQQSDSNLASADQAQELRQQHELEIAGLKTQFEQHENQALADQVTALSEQHDQDLADLRTQLERRNKDVISQRERELNQRHQQEIAQLNARVAQTGKPGSDSVESKIKQLQSEIQLRDDSIAVLRDDLAALDENRPIDQRGRQDEQLRAAINESVRWQDKYEVTRAKLLELKAANRETGRTVKTPDPEVVIKSVKKRHQRSSGDRIGSVLSHSGGPRDKLQEIKGIGPVLERKLNDFGIYHFKQIADFDSADIARVGNELGRLAGRIGRDKWVDQARILHDKYHS